jgi:hypothetical protein
MKNCIISILLLNLLFTAEAQVGVGIGTNSPDTSAMLEVASTTKGMLVPRMSTAQRTAIQNPANGLLVYDTNFNDFWFYTTAGWLALNNTKNAWSFSGNALAGTELLGSTNSLPLKFITNNTERLRLSENGNLLAGTTSANYTTSLMEVVGSSTYPFALRGISAFNGSGVYGEIKGGSTTFAAVQGEYKGAVGTNTAAVRGLNGSTVAGTGFRVLSATGPRVGVQGNQIGTTGSYSFGLHGSFASIAVRAGAVFGDNFGVAFGALGYYAASGVDYGVYGFGSAFQTGTLSGRNNYKLTEPNTQIGMGVYGGVMGGWMRGLVYGTHIKGERYSLYVDGKTYTNEPIVELVAKEDGSRMPAYNLATEKPEVYAKGKATLNGGEVYIYFNEAFRNMANAEDMVITVSALANSKGLFIARQDAKGFLVKENDNGKASVNFSWMAIATRKGIEQITHANEILEKDFDQKMNGVMFNDNDTITTPQYLWWDGQQIRFDKPAPKKIDTNHTPGARMKSN